MICDGDLCDKAESQSQLIGGGAWKVRSGSATAKPVGHVADQPLVDASTVMVDYG